MQKHECNKQINLITNVFLENHIFHLFKISTYVNLGKFLEKIIKSFILFSAFYSQPKILILGCDSRWCRLCYRCVCPNSNVVSITADVTTVHHYCSQYIIAPTIHKFHALCIASNIYRQTQRIVSKHTSWPRHKYPYKMTATNIVFKH